MFDKLWISILLADLEWFFSFRTFTEFFYNVENYSENSILIMLDSLITFDTPIFLCYIHSIFLIGIIWCFWCRKEWLCRILCRISIDLLFSFFGLRSSMWLILRFVVGTICHFQMNILSPVVFLSDYEVHNFISPFFISESRWLAVAKLNSSRFISFLFLWWCHGVCSLFLHWVCWAANSASI